MTRERDYYRVLDVPRTASPFEIQQAYRHQARLHHPDVSREPGAEERFKLIGEAYHVLADPTARRRYDRDEPTLTVDLPLTVEDTYRGGVCTVSTVDRTDAVRVNLPAGLTDGQRIRLGEAYLVVRLTPHPRYRVAGRDVLADLPATPAEAALGADVPLESPVGTIWVSLPAGSSSGRRLRLAGLGVPNPNGVAGDFYADVRVAVPHRLTARERELYEELARVSSRNWSRR